MVSNKFLGALALAACFVGACSSTDASVSPEQLGSSDAKLVSCAGVPVGSSLLTCSAFDTTSAALATQVQTQLITQMNAIFAGVSIVPNLAAQQVVISSTIPAFTTLFGTQIIAPLNAAGMFTVAVPFTVGTLLPGFTLTANIWGWLPVIPSASLAASTAATSAAITSMSLNTAAINAATNIAPFTNLSFWISTPISSTFPLACNGMLPFSCPLGGLL